MSFKCLIVEDALFLQEVYRFTLRGLPYHIIDTAIDGVEALIKLKKHQPDILILDLVLPLKNGLDVLKEVSHLSKNTKCLVVSSVDDQEIIKQSLALGAIKYLQKPFTKADLLQALKEITEQYNEAANG